MTSTSTPLRVAVIGSGPSGFFASEALFKALGANVAVDMFDRLPTPFGLVRGGVAPDHPKIKSVAKGYEKIAATAGFQFFGNVEIGRDLKLDELRRCYDAILFTTGAETDRHMDIPGENLTGSHAATEFVGWYNGHPDYENRSFNLDVDTAVVIGQGNVAMDVARLLAKSVEELKGTDIAQRALDAFAKSKVKNIYIVGRRGPAQAKFTAPELRELSELATCDAVVDENELALSAADEAELETGSEGAAAKRNVELLRGIVAHAREHGRKHERAVHLVFRLSPKRIEADEQGRVKAIVLEKTRLEGPAGNQKAVGTGETITIPCGIVFRSVGYKGKAIADVPFDAKAGTIPNDQGRVGAGLYCAGWIKRGPSGVIGTNKACAVETVGKIVEDQDKLTRAPNRDSSSLLKLLEERGVFVVTTQHWQKIDAAEIARGTAAGKPREKLATWSELLDVARKA